MTRKSNHRIAPEPVKMTRSGVDFINDLIGDDEDERQEETVDNRRYHGELRRDSQSRERMGSERGERPMSSRSRSSGRLDTRSSYNDSHYHYGSRADMSRRGSQDSLGRMGTGRMTAQEQAAYYSEKERELLEDPFGRKRSRRSTVDLEDQRQNAELKKRADRLYTRAWWHPASLIQSAFDCMRSSRVLVGSLLAIMLIAAVIAGLLTYFLWPRPVSISFADLEHDKNPQPYRVIPKEAGVHLRVQSWINVDVRNPNYFPAKVKKSQVIANWIKADKGVEMFGGSIIDAETLLKSRETKSLHLPVTIEYMGAPESDPIYSDFLERCYVSDEADKRSIEMQWEVQVTTEAKGVERTGVVLVSRNLACPLDREMIEGALSKLKIDPADLRKKKNMRM